jgi:hypothetical protein
MAGRAQAATGFTWIRSGKGKREMRTRYDEGPDLDRVSAYFAEKNLMTERFTVAETNAGKTPDFRVRFGEALVAYCEVKSPNDPWLDNLLDNAPAETIVGGGRPDPTFNRLARLLEKADQQFSAVNPDRNELNVLAYVNHDDASRFHDLIETVTGFFHAEGGEKHPTMMHVAARIDEAVRRIDCFLWFPEGPDEPSILVNQRDAERLPRICTTLKIEPTAIASL